MSLAAIPYGSVCSGHCAVTQALGQRGWSPSFFAEIEAFPAGILGQRFGATAPRHQLDPASVPAKEQLDWINNNRELDRMSNWAFGDAIPNLGDFTKIDPAEWSKVEWLWGGTPCQAFSIAGGRKGLKDHRGNLTLAFVGLAHELAATGSLRGLTWENVPGILSHKENPFGCFLAELVGHDAPIVSPHRKGRWSNAGVVVGPRCRAAWRILDTQHFGLPQRRRRLFVVASFGDGPDPVKILLEPKSLPRAATPSAESRQDVAPTLSAHTKGGGGLGTDFDLDGGVIPQAFGGNNTSGAIDIATAQTAHGGPHGRLDFASETFVCEPIALNAHEEPVHSTEVFGTLGASHPQAQAVCYSIMPMNSGKDFKARLTDVAQPVMAGGPVGGNQGGDYVVEPLPFDTTQITSAANGSNPQSGDPSHPLTSQGHPPAIAYPVEVAPTLDANYGRLQGCSGQDANNGHAMLVATAFSIRGRDGEAQIEPETEDVAPALRTGGGGSDKPFVATVQGAIRWAVRRLMPTECEALQGVERNFTRIPWRGKSEEECPDGPRYKGLGNAFSRNVIEWLGRRIIEAEAETAP